MANEFLYTKIQKESSIRKIIQILCGMANSETATTHNNPNKELSNHYKPFLKTMVLCDVSEKNI